MSMNTLLITFLTYHLLYLKSQFINLFRLKFKEGSFINLGHVWYAVIGPIMEWLFKCNSYPVIQLHLHYKDSYFLGLTIP